LLFHSVFCLFITIGAFYLTNACSEDTTFGHGHIIDIKLDSTESQALIVKINNGIYDYCRSLNVQTGEMGFDEISCTKNAEDLVEIPNYDIIISPNDDEDLDQEAFMALNTTEKVDLVEEREDTNLTVTFGSTTTVLLLEDIFIHPVYFAYFYSPLMKTLFIFTADQNETTMNPDRTIDEIEKIHLVTIAWNPDGSETSDFPLAALDEFEVRQQNTVTTNGLTGDAGPDSDFQLLLDGTLWRTYDDDNMFMVEVSSVITSCDDPEWLRYRYIEDLYEKRSTNTSFSDEFDFDHIGNGYIGIDTRLSRAYAFTPHTISYYQATSADFESFSEESFEFEHSDLSSYWVLMWFLIALFIVCCCCCCACYFKKKRDKRRQNSERFGGMTDEQYEMTQV